MGHLLRTLRSTNIEIGIFCPHCDYMMEGWEIEADYCLGCDEPVDPVREVIRVPKPDPDPMVRLILVDDLEELTSG